MDARGRSRLGQLCVPHHRQTEILVSEPLSRDEFAYSDFMHSMWMLLPGWCPPGFYFFNSSTTSMLSAQPSPLPSAQPSYNDQVSRRLQTTSGIFGRIFKAATRHFTLKSISDEPTSEPTSEPTAEPTAEPSFEIAPQQCAVVPAGNYVIKCCQVAAASTQTLFFFRRILFV